MNSSAAGGATRTEWKDARTRAAGAARAVYEGRSSPPPFDLSPSGNGAGGVRPKRHAPCKEPRATPVAAGGAKIVVHSDDDTGGLSGRPPLRVGLSRGTEDPAKPPFV